VTGGRLEAVQDRADWLTRKWWAFLLIALFFWFPPYTSEGFKVEQWNGVVDRTLSQALLYTHAPSWSWVFQIPPVVLAAAVLAFRNRAWRAFCLYAGFNFLLANAFQSFAVTERSGLSIITCNLVWFTLVGGLWMWEAVVARSDAAHPPRVWWRYWVLPLALYAFWIPVVLDRHGAPHFLPLFFVKMKSEMTFCLTTPLYLGLMSLYWPRVNLSVMRITSLVGTIIALCGSSGFLFDPHALTLVLVHVPLLLISVYSLVLSLIPRSSPHSQPGPS